MTTGNFIVSTFSVGFLAGIAYTRWCYRSVARKWSKDHQG